MKRPDCAKCYHLKNQICGGADESWDERFAICEADGMEERNAWIVACNDARRKMRDSERR
jgi:hypothetical protein